jgi:cell wall-associated NlpC family hydrolase
MNAVPLVDFARSCIGTPYHHQGRLPGVGLDCVGLVLVAAKKAGAVDPSFDVAGYARLPDGHSLMRHLRERLREVGQKEMKPGDVVCVAFAKQPQHVGVVGDYRHGGLSLIHADGSRGKVIETRLMFTERMRFVAAFRLMEND